MDKHGQTWKNMETCLKVAGESWGGLGRTGEDWGGMGRTGEVWGGLGESWGDLGRPGHQLGQPSLGSKV